MIRVSPQDLEVFLKELFLKYGACEEEAQKVTQHLIVSDLMGHESHGVLRASWYIEKIQKKEIIPGAPIEIEKETPTTAIVNGHWGFGQPIAQFAMRCAIEKASQNGISCVTIRQCNHVGRLGAYTSLASEAGMAAIAMANLHGTSHCVAPFGGREPRLPTNPISIAFPTVMTPHFLLDMTTSVVAEGKIQLRHNRGEELPEGWAIDTDGNPARLPSQFYGTPRGALLPLGAAAGYKGFALSLAIDALSGALSGADCSNPQSKRHGNACCFIVIRIDAFVSLEEFKTKVQQMTIHVKSSKLMEGAENIFIPGEPEHLRLRQNLKKGILVDEATWEKLADKASIVNLAMPNSMVEISS